MKYILIYNTVSCSSEFKVFDYETELIKFVEDWLNSPGEEFKILALYKGTPLKYELADRVRSIKIK